jgi:hypothetical protein
MYSFIRWRNIILLSLEVPNAHWGACQLLNPCFRRVREIALSLKGSMVKMRLVWKIHLRRGRLIIKDG